MLALLVDCPSHPSAVLAARGHGCHAAAGARLCGLAQRQAVARLPAVSTLLAVLLELLLCCMAVGTAGAGGGASKEADAAEAMDDDDEEEPASQVCAALCPLALRHHTCCTSWTAARHFVEALLSTLLFTSCVPGAEPCACACYPPPACSARSGAPAAPGAASGFATMRTAVGTQRTRVSCCCCCAAAAAD